MRAITASLLGAAWVAALLVGASADGGDPSYADLALCSLPDALEAAVQELIMTSESEPSGVKPLRKAVLRARDLLDVFAYAYSKRWDCNNGDGTGAGSTHGAVMQPSWQRVWHWASHLLSGPSVRVHGNGNDQDGFASSENENKVDAWRRLRLDLDKGYEVVGEFQDLSHSLVEYDEADAAEKRTACLDWQTRFLDNLHRYRYRDFVESASQCALYKHHHLSKLYWQYNGVEPTLRLSGYQNLGRLLRDSQLAQLLDLYPRVVALQDIIEESAHEQFHLFRKLLRSILAVCDSFPELLDMSREEGSCDKVSTVARTWTISSTSTSSASSSRHISAAGGRTRSRKLTAYSDSDSSSDDGDDITRDSTQGALSGRHALRRSQQQQQRKEVQEGQSRSDRLRGSTSTSWVQDDPGKGCAKATVDLFAQLMHDMGKVNDQIFAYYFYKERGKDDDAAEALEAVREGWRDVTDWMENKQVDECARCLAAALPAACDD